MTYATHSTASTWLKAQPPAAQREVRRLVKAYAKENRRTGGQSAKMELLRCHGLKAFEHGYGRIHDALERVTQPAIDALEKLDPEGGRDTAEQRLSELAYEFHAWMMPDLW